MANSLKRKLQTDVLVVGGGILGLVVADKLSQLGLSVILAEKQEQLLSGPSGHNVGMIHSGIYHCASLQDEAEALHAGGNCKDGFEWYRGNAGLALEESISRQHSYALFKTDSSYARAIRRADKLGIRYTHTASKNFSARNPEIRLQDSARHILQVEDLSINQRILGQLLMTRTQARGVRFYFGVNLKHIEPHKVLMSSHGSLYELKSENIVVAAGPGIKELYQDVVGRPLPLRFWKDHLLLLPRTSRDNVFHVESGEAMLFHHGNKSILVRLRDERELPTNDNVVDTEQVRRVVDSAKNLIYDFEKIKFEAIASTKIDLKTNEKRSVSEIILQIGGDITFASPGKMTAAPIVADDIVRRIIGESAKALMRIAPYPRGKGSESRASINKSGAHVSGVVSKDNAAPLA